MRLTNAPGSRSRRSCCEVSHRPVADGLSCAIWPRSPPVFARTFQTALVLLRPVWGSDPTPRRKRSVQRTTMTTNPSSSWQRSLMAATHQDCSASRYGGPLGVTGGKTRSEDMFSALAQIADIARSAFHDSANQPYCRSRVLWIMCSGPEQFHARLELNNATRLSRLDWL